ncbi:hypothetical protein LP419_31160 [Massilia sp. H-1]|nr:hypothetical protein LP419_31160 [Massilia sp. H-1]
MTIGYVFGKDDPFESTVRDVAAWDAFIRRHGDTLIKVERVADIRRAMNRAAPASSSASRTPP